MASADVTVAVLAGHNPTSWADDSGGCSAAKGQTLFECNLKVYTAAVATAAEKGVQMLVFPESYGFGNFALPTDYYEPLDDAVLGTALCNGPAAWDIGPASAQVALACAAKEHVVAVVVNIPSVATDGKRQLTELVFNTKGVLVSLYHKNKLFPTETATGITPGPYKPTTFEMFGWRWGILICYEGLQPFVPLIGSFDQMDALVEQGATAFVWSVGGTLGCLEAIAARISSKYGVYVVSTEDYSPQGSGYDYAAITDSTGTKASSTDSPVEGLQALGYTRNAFVQVAVLKSAPSVLLG